jgi:small subunit ribosomal protein S20
VSGFNVYEVFEQPVSHKRHSLSNIIVFGTLVDIIFLEVYELANIKSAKKRILVNETKAARNKAIKSKVKTMIKKVDAAVATGDKELAKTSLVEAVSEIDKACTKGIYHKNTAARKVSRLTVAVNKIA